MHIFYCTNRQDTRFILDENESKHLTRVLRLKKGVKVLVINGSGMLYTCELVNADPRKSEVEIIKEDSTFDQREYKLQIAIAPTKNNDRFEWFIEKSVELGIDIITPIVCKRSERKTYKTERGKRISVAAMKQSIKTRNTIIEEVQGIDEILKLDFKGKKFIAHCNDFTKKETFSINYSKGEDVLILIGPEGDFTDSEVEKALNQGFKELNLGSSRLRTETAGIAACSLVYFINQII